MKNKIKELLNWGQHFKQVSEKQDWGKTSFESAAHECPVQWGSEILTSTGFEWSRRGWFVNGLHFERDLKSGSPTTGNLPPFCQKPFEIYTKTSRF